MIGNSRKSGKTPGAARAMNATGLGDALRHPAAWAALSAVLFALAALVPWVLPGFAATAAVAALLALAAMALAARMFAAQRGAGRIGDLMVAAAEASPEACLLTGADEAFVYANSAFHRLFALAVSLDAIAAIVEGGDGPAREFARLRASAAAGIADYAELAVRIPAGAVEWRRISVVPARGHAGVALWRAEDVTARRELEAVRRREEETLADLLDHLPVGFFSADADGRMVYANQTLAGWLGMEAADVRARALRFADFVAGADSAPRSDEPGEHGEVMLRASDGETFRAYLVQSQQTAKDGGFLYSRSVVMRASAAGEASGAAGVGFQRQLHWLFDEAPVGIALIDPKGDVIEANRALLRLLGLHRDAVIGSPLADRIRMEDRGDVAGALSKVLMGALRAAHFEVGMPGAGRRELIVSIYASRMEDETGDVSAMILHFIDMTEQKHLEVQFAQSQKTQAVGQLAGGVAHDFNNLLTAMIGFCDLLLERHGAGDPSFADIMQIKQNANRATNLVRQLLAFSRKQTLQPVMLDVTQALSDLSNLLRRLIGENIELNMEHGRDLGLMRADPGQFDQVVINLAVNARDAMPGGGTVTIRTSEVTVEAPVERGAELIPAGAYVLIEVMDTGTGITKENIGLIFEPFFSTKQVGAGTGLGLSTVYGIVRQSDGFIFVDSAPGEGTAFSLYFPAYAEVAEVDRAAPAPDTDADEADLTGAGTVLLVEDEDAVRMFGARALRNKGYRVLEADNGEAALEVVNGAGAPIDLIISDVVMPGMDGYTLIKLVRQQNPGVKVILISGYAEDAIPEEIGRDPSVNFLPKPFSLKQLAGRVKEVMGG
jgi:two-component system, cell cycle sensor histidine kinase and response regulator CckA